MVLGFLLLVGGLVIILGLLLWSRQRQVLGEFSTAEAPVSIDPALATNEDAVLVSREHGQLIYVNERARRWVGLNGGDPNLEYIAQMVQPADSFLELFLREGQASFKLGSRWVEASSHTIPSGSERRTVVVMRELTASTSNPDLLDLSLAMAIINEIGETINASMSIEQVLQTLLTVVMKAVPASAGEICLWDPATQTLHPRGWVGEAQYLLALAEAGGVYRYGEGLSGWMARSRRPVLVADVDDVTAIQPKLSNFYRSFAGVPLILGERFVGTLELAHVHSGTFNQAHLALLQAISKPAATAIYNAELYSAQAQRITDMARVQEVAEDRAALDDPRRIYRGLTERIARLVNADICGVLLYNENRRALAPEPPFFGLPDYALQNYLIPVPPGSPQHAIWQDQPYWVTNDADDEPLIEALGLKPLFSVSGIRNTAFLPLEIGAQRVGMLQISNKRTAGGFTPQDIQDLRILAAQAAVVVENVRLFQREQRRDTELVGMQEMTHAIGALSRAGEFYSTLTERIARLMDIRLCGILLADETGRRLVAQTPFYGVEEALVRDYAVDLPPNSPLDVIWQQEDYWYTNRVQADAVIYAAGLEAHFARLGIEKTLLAVLTVGGRRLGVVQAANKVSGEDFTDKDARLLLIFAAQAAAIIENARLYQDVQQRAQEATRLREIAEMAGAILTAEESFDEVLGAIAEVTGSPQVFINVLDASGEALITYPRLVFGRHLAEPLVHNLEAAGGRQPSVALSGQAFISDDVLGEPNLPESYRRAAQQFDLRRVVVVPLTVGERVLGELGVANRAERPYTREDQRLVEAIAAQIAATVERIRLYEAAAQNLTRRELELDAIARVSHELTQTLDLSQVLDVLRREAARATGADDSTIVLLRPPGLWKDPNIPEMEFRLGGAYFGLADIEQEAVLRGADTVLVPDYRASDMQPFPEGARSAIAGAFLFEDRVVGVIHLYHSRANHFDERAAAFLLTMAAKASLGFGNSARYEEQIERSNRLRRRMEQLNQIFELGQMLQSSVDQVTLLESILYGIQQSVGFDAGVASLTDTDAGLLRRVAQAGLPLDLFEQSRGDTIAVEQVQALLRDPYRVSESYFFPAEAAADWRTPELRALDTGYQGLRRPPADERAWQPGDLFLLPLLGSGGELLGVISLDAPQDGHRPDRSTVEVLEIFMHQASAMIENARLYLASLQSAEQEARLNAVMEAVSRTLNVDEIIEAVAYGALRLVPFMHMNVALVDMEQPGFDLVRVDVNPDGTLVIGHDYRTDIEGTALGRTWQDGQDYLYQSDDPDAGSYADLRAWHERGEHTSLVLPLVAGGEPLGAMHLGSDLRRAFGFNEFRPLLKRMANLSAVAIQNARLFNRALNLQAFNESVVQSIQQGIIVLDKSGRILSANDFMRQRYGWDLKQAVRQDLFAYSPDLAEDLAADLRQVLEDGTPRERIWQQSLQSENLVVRNFYLYPLRSAEMIRGAVVLVEDVTERARLERDVEARASQLAVLTEVSSRITSSLNRDEVINLALEEMERVLDYDTMTLWSRAGDFLILEGSSGFDEDVVIAADENTQVRIMSHERLRTVVETQRPYAINHLQGWDVLPGEGPETHSWLGVPLVNQGYVVGMIALSKQEPSFYTAQSQQAAFAFANQVAVALANADLFAESQRRTERLSLLNRVSVSLAQSLDSENILETALREIAQVLGIGQARALIFERDLQIGRVIVKYPRGDEPPEEFINLLESPTYTHIRRTASSLVYEDIYKLAPDHPAKQELSPRGVTAFALIPMTVGGQVIGAFELEVRTGPRFFTPEQIDLGQIIANQAAIAVQNTNLLEQTLARTRELETLLEAAQATSLTLNLEEVFNSVVSLMLHALDMDSCGVMLWDNVEGVLHVEVEVNRLGAANGDAPARTEYNLRHFPSRLRALEQREVVVIRANNPDADRTELALLNQSGDQLRVLIPLVVRDQAIGLAQVGTQTQHRSFGHRELRLAQALGAQAAIAIQNARLSTETAALVEEGFLMNSLSQAIASTLTIDEMIAVVRDQVPRLTSAEEMYLALYNPDDQTITFPVAVRRDGSEFVIPPRQMGSDEVSFVIRHRRSLPLGGGNWSSDDMRRNLGITNGEGAALSYLGVPVASGDQVLGVLAVRDSHNSRAFGINDERLLTTVGTQLGAAIQNARLFQKVSTFAEDLNRMVEARTLELQQERDRLDTLYRITSDLATTLDMDRVLSRALELVSGAVAAEDGVILLVNPMTDRLFPRAVLRGSPPENGDGSTHPVEGLARWLIQHGGRSLVVEDLAQQTDWDASAAVAQGWQSAVAVLLENNDDIHGVMVLLSAQRAVFTDTQVKLVIAAANQVAAAIYNAELYHLIRDQAERLGMLVRAEREETEKSNAIVEGIADGVMLADAEGVIVLFNSAAERILGLQRDDVIGQTIFRLTGLFGGSASLWARAIQEWALDPERHKPGEFLAETLDLGKRVVNVHLSPVHIADRFLGTVSVFRDITKEVEVDRIKSEFVSNVSHELRTPMTSIKGFADLLLMGVAGQVSEGQRDFLLKIKANADRLSHLVDDLLNISKIDAGERLRLEPVNLSDVVENVMNGMRNRPDYDQKDLHVVVNVPTDLPPVEADAQKLTQILHNIVDNAFNYTYAGGTVAVTAALQSDDRHVLISVKDTGIGIPQEFRSRIWQRFERYDEHALVMEVAGTGLGLSIVKELVEMHHGEVWFESEQGKGTTFFISLPIEQPRAEDAA